MKVILQMIYNVYCVAYKQNLEVIHVCFKEEDAKKFISETLYGEEGLCITKRRVIKHEDKYYLLDAEFWEGFEMKEANNNETNSSG